MRMPLCLVLCVVLTTSLAAQVPNNLIRDEIVALTARVDVPSVVYARSDLLVPVVFAGDSVVMEVALSNFTPVDLRFGAADEHWARFVSIEVTHQPMREQGVAAQRLRGRFESIPASAQLSKGASSVVKFPLESDTSERLLPGRYEILVSLRLESLPLAVRKLNNKLAQKVPFEVRDPETRPDVLDYHAHQIFYASREGRLTEAREWTQRLLLLNPNSVFAASQMARLALRLGDCNGALAQAKRYATIVELELDADLDRSWYNDLDPGLLTREIIQKCRSSAGQ